EPSQSFGRAVLDLSTAATNLHSAPEIEWRCGVKTRLPRMRDLSFPFEERQVQEMATFPNAEDCPDMVEFVHSDPQDQSAGITKVMMAQARGRMVVLKGGGHVCVPTPDGGDPAMNLEYLSCASGTGRVGAALDIYRQVHDMELRQKGDPPPERDPNPQDDVADDSIDEEGSVNMDCDPPAGQEDDASTPEPYIERSIRQFVENVWSDQHLQAILDIPGGYGLRDLVTCYLSDGHLETSTSSYAVANHDYEFRPADFARTGEWYLLHQGGFFTYGHIDASGMATSFEIRGPGAKLWLVLEYCPPADATRSMLMQGQKSVVLGIPRRAARPQQTDDGAGRPDFSVDHGREIRGCVLVLQEGDRVFQPPGKAHVVYTPLPTVTAGEHYLNWGSLHHTEFARAFEKHTNRQATNHDHLSVQLMLIFMAASLPARVKEGRVFHRKPLIALCLMVLWPRKYIHADSVEDRVGKLNDDAAQQFLLRLRDHSGNWVRGSIDRLAQLVCLALLKKLVPDMCPPRMTDDEGMPILPDISPIRQSYLFLDLEDHRDWQQPGPQVDLEDHLESYRNWTPPEDDPVLLHAR
ncbi:hypothetical protein EV715DRAFT_172304, partial [Schizophyllum commune]